jgi:hypothetical protein
LAISQWSAPEPPRRARKYHGRVPSANAQPLTFAVREALVKACGTVFHWKSGLVALFVSSGVPEPMVTRYVDQGLVKFQIARSVLSDLDGRGAEGHRVQHQIVESILDLTGPADNEADAAAAKAALATLREAAGPKAQSPQSDEEAAARSRRAKADLRRQAQARQAQQIAELRGQFAALETERNAQKRGYAFEAFLAELFRAFDIEYRPSYRTGLEQIDGAFHHSGRDYLVEAKWTKLPPDTNDLFDFAMKVSGKLDGTLGLVITTIAPAAAILEHVAKQSRRILVMDGRDLALILEGQISLPEALDLKSRRAAQEGVLFVSLAGKGAAS